jgi:hypothetical protein
VNKVGDMQAAWIVIAAHQQHAALALSVPPLKAL